MGGDSYEDEWARGIFRRIPTSDSGSGPNSVQNRNIVLVGKTGNGKSSTCNSIIGRDAFKSEMSSASVTTTCEMQTTKERNRIINVIDTPGLFEFSIEVEQIVREIMKCINMAKGGIHAVVVVFSVRSRFSQEEHTVIERLRKFFGNRISDYMIVVFTGADDLGEKSLDDYLSGCPKPLQETIRLCNNRCLLFDNKTKNADKKSEQLQELLSLVDDIVSNNGGKPYSDELFVQKERDVSFDGEVDNLLEISKQDISEFKEQLKIKTVESKLKVATSWFEERLANEQASRLEAEAEAKDEIRVLRGKLLRAEKEAGELMKDRENFEKLKKTQVLRDKLKRAEEEAEEQNRRDKAEKVAAAELKKKHILRDRLSKNEVVYLGKVVRAKDPPGGCAIL